MLKDPIETPVLVLEALKKKSISLSARSRCESFAADEASLSCLVCTAQAHKAGAPCLVVALLAPTPAAGRAFLDRLEGLIEATRIKIPKIDVSHLPGVTILLAPWVYRGEFRALVASAVASYIQPFAVTGPSCLFSSSLPQEAPSGSIDMPALKQTLYDFAMAFDSVWRQGLRRMTKFEDKSRWGLPLGCIVEELVTSGGVEWEMHFQDLELLERAHVLVESRLDSGKADSLVVCPNSINPVHETQLPVIRLRAKENSRDVRIEMARLLQSVLVFMDRMTFREARSAVSA